MYKSYRRNRKQHRINGDKRNRIGLPTGILASDGSELLTGDKIFFSKSVCIVLYGGRDLNTFEACPVKWCWFGEKNLMDYRCYSTSFTLPKDNGAKMTIFKID